jgi:hypothetical protein
MASSWSNLPWTESRYPDDEHGLRIHRLMDEGFKGVMKFSDCEEGDEDGRCFFGVYFEVDDDFFLIYLSLPRANITRVWDGHSTCLLLTRQTRRGLHKRGENCPLSGTA